MNIVYMMYEDIWDHIDEDTFMTLFPNRHERSKKYVFASDRFRCISVGILLYKVLGLVEKDIYTNEFGKPFSNKGPQFSISHSGDYVALAYASAAIGIDVEKIEEKYLDIMSQVFTKEEISYVRSDSQRFYKIWTLKESLSKAVGKGLSMPMREISVLGLLEGLPIQYKGKEWYGFTTFFGNNTYVMSGVKDEKIVPDIEKLEK